MQGLCKNYMINFKYIDELKTYTVMSIDTKQTIRPFSFIALIEYSGCWDSMYQS